MSNTILKQEFQKGKIAQMAERAVVINGPYGRDGQTITKINKKHTQKLISKNKPETAGFEPRSTG